MSGNVFETVTALLSGGVQRLKENVTASLETDRDDTASSVLQLPGADRCPPIVQFQMIVDYIRRFNDVSTAARKKNLEFVLNRLARLSIGRLQADIAMKYELKELARLEKYLVQRGMDTKSAHTQTPRPPQMPPKKIVKTVKFREPVAVTTDEISTESKNKFEKIKRAYTCLKTFAAAVKKLFGWTVACLEEPVVLSKIAEKIVRWSGNLIDVTIDVNTAIEETSVSVHVLPNIPGRPAHDR